MVDDVVKKTFEDVGNIETLLAVWLNVENNVVGQSQVQKPAVGDIYFDFGHQFALMGNTE